MAIKPILFNTEMVRAILEGRKSCKRRIIKPQPQGYFEVSEEPLYIYDTDGKQGKITPPYQPGDILYVRETFVQPATHIFWYRADNAEYTKNILWQPSIRMPKEAARIWLKVTNVYVQLLQEITEDGCIAEGVYPSNCRGCNATFGCDNCPDEGSNEIDDFSEIWNSTVKKSDLDRYGWNANPWVWVIEFERCEKPEGV